MAETPMPPGLTERLWQRLKDEGIIHPDSEGPRSPAVHVFSLRECSTRARRAIMTDDEFWADVYPQFENEPTEPDMDCIGIDSPTPCPECGSTVACGYDSEGRPMIHVVQEDDDA